MSFVLDHVRAIDARLDRFQLSALSLGNAEGRQETISAEDFQDPSVSARISQLQEVIKSLSAPSTTKASLCSARECSKLLQEARLSEQCSTCRRFGTDHDADVTVDYAPHPTYEHELEWFLVSKATAQVYGLVLDALINQAVPLSDELWYWENMLASYRHLALYSVQTSPLRLWQWSKTIYREVQKRDGFVTRGWGDFYRLVRSVVHERSIADIQRRVATPLTLVQTEARLKRDSLGRARIKNANGIGYLLSNTFDNESFHKKDYHPEPGNNTEQGNSGWKSATVRTVAVLDAILCTASSSVSSNEQFERQITVRLDADPFEHCYQAFISLQGSGEGLAILLRPADIAARLQDLLQQHLPSLAERSNVVLRTSSRPSVFVRYWLPATMLLLSSSTIYRLVINRGAAILDSVRDLGRTVIDFWSNWVIEPVRNIIGTIRHDAASEVSLMSKGSLEGDRASLERMVIDFAKDNTTDGALDSSAIDLIKAKVREGDLTTVLRVYEKELQHPLRGSVMGSLVRALLIQVQKTKVDVEIAMGGIDSLLKSQELVFGFVGLTPGMLVTYFVVRWLSNLPTSRRNARSGEKHVRAYQILRDIDRILTASPQPNHGQLSFHEHGLLVCEAVALRSVATRTFPKQVLREFLQDFDDLIDVESGVGRQVRVADRVRWAYAKWL